MANGADMIDLNSEAHRHQCELNYLRAQLPNQRDWYLQQIELERSKECADKLREDLKK